MKRVLRTPEKKRPRWHLSRLRRIGSRALLAAGVLLSAGSKVQGQGRPVLRDSEVAIRMLERRPAMDEMRSQLNGRVKALLRLAVQQNRSISFKVRILEQNLSPKEIAYWNHLTEDEINSHPEVNRLRGQLGELTRRQQKLVSTLIAAGVLSPALLGIGYEWGSRRRKRK